MKTRNSSVLVLSLCLCFWCKLESLEIPFWSFRVALMDFVDASRMLQSSAGHEWFSTFSDGGLCLVPSVKPCLSESKKLWGRNKSVKMSLVHQSWIAHLKSSEDPCAQPSKRFLGLNLRLWSFGGLVVEHNKEHHIFILNYLKIFLYVKVIDLPLSTIFILVNLSSDLSNNQFVQIIVCAQTISFKFSLFYLHCASQKTMTKKKKLLCINSYYWAGIRKLYAKVMQVIRIITHFILLLLSVRVEIPHTWWTHDGRI